MRQYANRRKAVLKSPAGGNAGGIFIWGAMSSSKKPVWDKSRPKDLPKAKALTPAKKSSAKAAAKAAGRPYPNLVDNMRAARKK